MSLLTVICPCYNEEESISLFYQKLMKNTDYFTGKGVDLELLFVDDGSHDGTLSEIKKLREADERVHFVSFSRNFGKEAAMFAGLEKAKGEYLVIMDVDLQDPPSLLPEMFSYVEQGYDSVATRRVNRKGEPVIRSFFARAKYDSAVPQRFIAFIMLVLPLWKGMSKYGRIRRSAFKTGSMSSGKWSG